ncbi:hypothetical protein GS502_11035 [Rhodococcus hoagii]|nr:hypothetical protein [Prescottella equi]
MSTPEIYVATLVDYTHGHLNAAWLEIHPDEPLDAQADQLRSRSRFSNPEELIILDTENFQGIDIPEFMSLDDVSRIGLRLREHGAPYAAFVRHGIASGNDPYAYFPAQFLGEYDDREAWAEDVTEGLLPLLGATVAAWGLGKRLPRSVGDRTNLRDIRHALHIDGDGLSLIAETNWGYTFAEHNGKVFVFSN